MILAEAGWVADERPTLTTVIYPKVRTAAGRPPRRFSMKRKQRSQAGVPPMSRVELAARHGRVWDTVELAREFVVTAIIDGVIVVRRKEDGAVGQMSYQNQPRYYYGYEPHKGE